MDINRKVCKHYRYDISQTNNDIGRCWNPNTTVGMCGLYSSQFCNKYEVGNGEHWGPVNKKQKEIVELEKMMG